jgi:hypothetical protein
VGRLTQVRAALKATHLLLFNTIDNLVYTLLLCFGHLVTTQWSWPIKGAFKTQIAPSSKNCGLKTLKKKIGAKTHYFKN